jgi:hypothetical protein
MRCNLSLSATSLVGIHRGRLTSHVEVVESISTGVDILFQSGHLRSRQKRVCAATRVSLTYAFVMLLWSRYCNRQCSPHQATWSDSHTLQKTRFISSRWKLEGHSQLKHAKTRMQRSSFLSNLRSSAG